MIGQQDSFGSLAGLGSTNCIPPFLLATNFASAISVFWSNCLRISFFETNIKKQEYPDHKSAKCI